MNLYPTLSLIKTTQAKSPWRHLSRRMRLRIPLQSAFVHRQIQSLLKTSVCGNSMKNTSAVSATDTGSSEQIGASMYSRASLWHLRSAYVSSFKC